MLQVVVTIAMLRGEHMNKTRRHCILHLVGSTSHEEAQCSYLKRSKQCKVAIGKRR